MKQNEIELKYKKRILHFWLLSLDSFIFYIFSKDVPNLLSIVFCTIYLNSNLHTVKTICNEVVVERKIRLRDDKITRPSLQMVFI